MFKRLGAILVASTVLLVACQDESDWTKLEGVEVVKIDTQEYCARGCWHESVITLKKDDLTFKLQENDGIELTLLSKGQVIDVYYNDDYYLKKYELSLKKVEQK